MSLSTMFTLYSFPNAVAIVSDKIAVAVSVPLFILKPCCLGFCKLFISRWFISLMLIIFSKVFPGTFYSEIGL